LFPEAYAFWSVAGRKSRARSAWRLGRPQNVKTSREFAAGFPLRPLVGRADAESPEPVAKTLLIRAPIDRGFYSRQGSIIAQWNVVVLVVGRPILIGLNVEVTQLIENGCAGRALRASLGPRGFAPG
jgi:hypothetical protein